MINTLSKLAQKPTDKNIRIVRIVFALILVVIITFWFPVTHVNFGIPQAFEYILYIFPSIGLIRGIFDPGIFRKKVWKWTIFGLGVTMLLISLFLIDDVAPVQNILPETVSGEIQLSDIHTSTQLNTPFTLSTDNWFWFFGPILMILWFLLNGKNITQKNERYGEKVKKIRV